MLLLRMLAAVSIRKAKAVVLVWIVFLFVFGLLAPRLPSVLQDHGLRSTEGSYAQVQRILSQSLPVSEHPVLLLFENRQGLGRAEFHRAIEAALTAVRDIDGVLSIVSPLASPGMENGHFAYAQLHFGQEASRMEPVIREVKRRLPVDASISVQVTGKSVVQQDVNAISHRDLKRAEWIGLPVAFLLLWMAFGSLWSALIPVLVGWIAVIGSMGILYAMGNWMELSVFVLSVIPMVGLALCLDFALMLVSRFREELYYSPVEQAIMASMRAAGRAVLFSAGSVFLCLAAMLLIRMPMFQSIAVGAMTVLAVSVLASLTLVPALLTLVGHRLQPSSGLIRLGSSSFSKRLSAWHSIAKIVGRRPVLICVLTSLFLLGCLTSLLQMKLAIPDAVSLPAGVESREAAVRLDGHFSPAVTSPVIIVAEGDQLDLVQSLRLDPEVADVGLRPLPGDGRMLITVVLRSGPASPEARAWIERLERQTESRPMLIGGEAMNQKEVFDALYQKLPQVLFAIVVSNFLILFVAFRSLLLAVKTLLMNFLSIGAAFGLLAWIAQEGHFGLEPTPVALMIPVFIFGLAFGISMDYGVFLIARIRELYRATGDHDYAVQEGLALTGRVITSAAAIMIAVTVPFAFGGVSGVRQLGIGIAAAILIDATVVRLLLVPSLMKLLGRWNWWPSK
ncbi:MMPL family transporter [Paenibacillus koleovorans]|uniref:MMPL family transporter n=1 Tax=Paenibacillus koleovorans TaxID=121608 RepID=UPI001FEC0452|nr:MMPL family transporter [Paenibacillus koleovorans]